VQAASLEERRRIEAKYKTDLAAVERRLREAAEKERQHQRSAKQLVGSRPADWDAQRCWRSLLYPCASCMFGACLLPC
jgi:hypothetical protein